ncbi:hypothetical protein [Bacteroides sp.]|uniref:hypothetical protein n=1 Tax=Bacteroides sp. TaxID=29523 RepID=UPI002588BBF3|nr:hypothetical protein [Bacteroides sp.]
MEKEPGKKTGKGGAREGSGRKAVSGMYTKTMRVPTVMEEEVLCLIDMYSNWLKHGKMEKVMARRTTPEQRMRAIRSIQEILDYEKQSQKARTNRKKRINGSCLYFDSVTKSKGLQKVPKRHILQSFICRHNASRLK